MLPFNALVADPSAQNRLMIKSAARSLPEFSDVTLLGSLEEVRARLNTEPSKWDLVFVSYRINSDTALSFLKDFLGQNSQAETAIIQVLQSSEATDARIAAFIAKGFNGILCEPFSGDGLRSCAKQSVALRLGNSKKRVRVALRLLVPLLAREHTQIVKSAKLNREKKELSDTCVMIKEMAEYIGSSYEQIILEVFDDLQKDPNRVYSGHSLRLKERFSIEVEVQEQLREELLAL